MQIDIDNSRLVIAITPEKALVAKKSTQKQRLFINLIIT
jgi:hypothetical protein